MSLKNVDQNVKNHVQHSPRLTFLDVSVYVMQAM